MVGMAEMGAPISLDELTVHPDCWCVCLCYLHFDHKIQKMAKCIFCYQLTRVVPDKVQRAVKWLCLGIWQVFISRLTDLFWFKNIFMNFLPHTPIFCKSLIKILCSMVKQACFVILYTTMSDHGDRGMLMMSIAGGFRGSKQVNSLLMLNLFC